MFWRDDTYIAYSDDVCDGWRNIVDCSFTKAKVSRITADGTEFLYETDVKDGKIHLKADAAEALLIEKVG